MVFAVFEEEEEVSVIASSSTEEGSVTASQSTNESSFIASRLSEKPETAS